MLKNFLKLAIRGALRYKGYTTLNLLGLMVGIASSTLILLWVHDETSMDQFHENRENIFQVFRNMKQSGGEVSTTFSIPKPMADLMKNEYSEVDQVSQISWEIDMDIALGDKHSTEQGLFATPNFLTLFSFELLEGDKESVLDELGSIVISRQIAEKYFGSAWREKALGSMIEIDGEREAQISAVFENPGSKSSLQFDWLLPAEYFFNRNRWVNDWGNGSFRIYFSLHATDQIAAVKARMHDEIMTHAAGQDNTGEEYLIAQQFSKHYLYSNFDKGEINGGRIDYVNILFIVALFIIIIAAINFMNLATARSGRRSKEIGLRKVMGAHKGSISVQFFFESILLASLATLCAVLIVWLALPYFNELASKQLMLDFSQPITWYFLVGIALSVGVLSGLYPAVLLPTFDILKAMKGPVKQSLGVAYIRKGLVAFQFGISTLLIIGTGIIFTQLDYILNKDLGLDKENVVQIRLGRDFGERLQTYRSELQKIPEVKAMTAASGNPLSYGRSTSSARWEGMSAEGYEINVILTDEYFTGTMGMEVLQGRDFDDQLSDSTNFLINEVMANLMGFDDPLNKRLSFWGINGNVVGVVKNFHMSNMRESIAPLIITCIDPGLTDRALIRLQGDPNKALKAIESITLNLNESQDFNYEFLDESYAETFQSEATLSALVRIFAGISIFLSCLGLLGLSSFTAEQRSKEVGIRKVHGASISHLVLLLSKDYSRLMILAFVIAAPIGYFYAQHWLNNFEFRTTISPSLFFLAGFSVFLVGALTVGAKSYQAARANPVKTLKDE